jgi:FAD:protein FMN transferase
MSRWRTLRFDFQAMASPCCLQLDGRDEKLMRQAARAAMDEVRRIEYKFSRYRSASVVSRINQNAGGAAMEVDDETWGLLEFAHQLWQQSEGLFDITSGVLRRAWDFKSACLPDPAVLTSLVQRVGWQGVERSGHRVRLAASDMELDFGGFGKEYAADRAAAVLKAQGIEHALVNLGGDLHALGGRGLPQQEGAPWQIEIRHPRPVAVAAEQPLAFWPLGHGALATSGDYERFFELDGCRYCHVLNPFTGWPVSHWQSISIVAGNTTSAGALSTIAMLKEADALPWLQSQGVSFLAVRHDGHITRYSH